MKVLAPQGIFHVYTTLLFRTDPGVMFIILTELPHYLKEHQGPAGSVRNSLHPKTTDELNSRQVAPDVYTRVAI